ncbi:M1 family aminopeptidase [Reichenbachiella sp.]|uniref:ABC transporter permease/M1 family aminopeptidase n=1 Tax=Reichenbachiella sp. TaxID=2184521 RepID=UPI003B5B5821
MFSQLLRFEAFLQVKQKAFMIFAFIFLFYGLVTGAQGFAPANVNFNSGYQINYYTGLISLGCVFIIMFLSIGGVLRDKRHGMEHLVFSTPISKALYFSSRFTGLYLFSLLSFVPFLFGYAFMISFGNLDPSRIAAFEFMRYVQPFFLIVAPNIFFCSALIFAVTVLTKSNIATYVSAFFIYMLYMLSSMFLNSPMMAQSVPASPEAMAIAALADPFGLAAFFEQTQYWTAYQKNTQLLSFSGLYLWNRIIWTGFSLLVLFITYRLFSFRVLTQKSKKQEEDEQAPLIKKIYRPVAVVISSKSQRLAFLSQLKLEWAAIFKSLPFLAIQAIWIIIVFMECMARINNGGAYNDSWYPLTNLLIDLYVDPLMLFAFIMIVFYSGELVWRERSFRFNTIIDASPVANWSLFLSKFLVLISLPMTLIAVAIFLSVGFQISMGFLEIEWSQYLALFYFYGLRFIIFCLIALFLQSVTRNKFLAMGLTLMIILFSFLAPKVGVEHLMLRPGSLTLPTYTNMTGYSAETLQFAHQAIFWLAFSGLLTLFTFKLWQRRVDTNLRMHLGQVLSNWKNWERISLSYGLAIFIGMGSLIWYNTHVVNEYYTADDTLDFREGYERKFKKYESLTRLYHTDMKVEVNLYPKRNRYLVKADYVMINKEEEPMTQLFITEKEPLSKIWIENAGLVEHDEYYGTYLYAFESPVMPNQKVKISFEIDREFKGYETSQELVENGTYLMHRSFEPVLKYRESMEISDNFERAKRGLPHKEVEEVSDLHLTEENYKIGRVNYETVISTSADEIAIGTGALVNQWSEPDRNYFHFKSDQLVMPTVAYFSSAYEVRKEKIEGIDFEQYYFPKHDFNIDSISSSVQSALAYCNVNFGPYPLDHLRIAEVPSHWQMGGFAHPGLISMVEDNLYLIDIREADEFNLVAKRTIHEVAHQWWGHQLAPKVAPGASFFIEGLAKYTEAVVMKEVYGKKAWIQLGETARMRYFNGRAFTGDKEQPLYLVDGQSHLVYGKALTVMLGLQELLGEKAINTILKGIVDEHGGKEPFELTTLMFLEKLYEISTVDQKALIDDWFKKVITYELSIEEVEVEALDNGQFELTIQVEANRFETNEEGEEEPIGIDEAITIGVFSKDPSIIKGQADVLYLKPHAFHQEKSEIKIVVDENHFLLPLILLAPE